MNDDDKLKHFNCWNSIEPSVSSSNNIVILSRQNKTLAVQSNLPVSKIEPLTFNINSEVFDIIQIAKENIDLLVQDVEISSFTFDAFGKEDIKALNMSPDSFIQIAIQMAYIKY